MNEPLPEVRARYQAALERFVEKVKQDPYIIAAILCGSLSHDTVWEKSDIDMLLVGRDEKRPVREYALVEGQINIHTIIYSRSRFKQAFERSLHGSFFHSYMSKSTLLFTHDETIRAYYDDIKRLGQHDRELQLLRLGANAIPILYKAEKWLYVKHDPAYSYLWVMYMLDILAQIEVTLNGEVVTREVVQQAMKYNPDFFNAIYFDLLDRPKNTETMQRILVLIADYIGQHALVMFRPVLEYLAQAEGPRTTTELETYFRKRMLTEEGGAVLAYEWLADQGIIERIPIPLRLTEKSKASVDEAAYFYNGE